VYGLPVESAREELLMLAGVIERDWAWAADDELQQQRVEWSRHGQRLMAEQELDLVASVGDVVGGEVGLLSYR
jgi:hypothetical protein